MAAFYPKVPRVRTLASIWSWLAIALVVLFGFAIQLVLFVLTAPFDRRRYVCGRFFRLIGVTAARLIPTWHFGTSGEIPRGIPGRTIVVGNHASQADPFLISFLPWEMKWLSKAAMFRVPVVGWCMWLAGDIPVTRGEAASAAQALNRCKLWLDRGVPVMIFPEGTRSQTDELLPFKDGAFRLAIETGADILPVALSGTRKSLPKHSWRFQRARARVTVGTPIATAGMTLADVPRLKELAREQILRLRAQLQAAA